MMNSICFKIKYNDNDNTNIQLNFLFYTKIVLRNELIINK